MYRGVDKTWSKDFDITLHGYTDAGRVSLHYICCGTGDGTYGHGCDVGYPDVEVASANVGSAYTPSSIWLNPNDYTKISKVNIGSWSVHYSYNAGSNSNVPISLAIHDYDRTSWGVRWEPVLRYVNGSSDGVWDSYTLGTDRGFSDGQRYRITLVSKGGEALSPSSWDPRQGLTIYTYRKPTLNNSVTIEKSSQNANQSNTFLISGINNRAWSDYEDNFQTRYRIKRGNSDWTGWTNIGNTDGWSRNASEMRTLVPKDYDAQTIQIRFQRYNSRADYASDNSPSGSFIVYYRPKIDIVGNDVSYKDIYNTNIPKSKIIAKHKLTDVNVSWNYDTSQVLAGYTQGYRIRLYNNDNTLVKSYYTANKNYNIPVNDIPADGRLTYIDVTPYFGNDQSSLTSANYADNYWYYNDGPIEKIPFIIVSNRLNKPIITYPVNNSNWINDDFRICFQLPDDADKDSISGTYKYDNIEFDINNKIYKFTQIQGDTLTPNDTLITEDYTFSSKLDDLTYQKKIIIWPNANNIIKNNIYNIRVRVKRPYNATIDTDWGWSEWSDTVTLIKLVPQYEVNQGELILASHFNEVRDAVNNAKNTYGVLEDISPRAIRNTTIIEREQYTNANMFKRIIDTKNQVNNYGPIHRDLVRIRFDYQNQIITSFDPIIEIVTAGKDKSYGRNYMKYIYDNVILLK